MLSLLELLMEVESGLKTKKELPSKLPPKTAKVRELKGTWMDIHDKPMSFNARRFHKIEPHEGQMWALAAYTPQAFERCSDEVRSKLEELALSREGVVSSHSVFATGLCSRHGSEFGTLEHYRFAGLRPAALTILGALKSLQNGI